MQLSVCYSLHGDSSAAPTGICTSSTLPRPLFSTHNHPMHSRRRSGSMCNPHHPGCVPGSEFSDWLSGRQGRQDLSRQRMQQLKVWLLQMEVVMPSRMTVKESHDIALVLQHKVEGFDEVERAFVHGESSACACCAVPSCCGTNGMYRLFRLQLFGLWGSLHKRL